MPIQIASVAFGDNTYEQNTGHPVIALQDSLETVLMVSIMNPTIAITPASLTVTVSEALSSEDVVFLVDGIETLRHPPDSTGSLSLVSVPVPATSVTGEHDLVVLQGVSGSGAATFTVLNAAIPPPVQTGPDAPPVQIPGAIQLNGVRRWVLQDLMPGGLGSWVMPMNPAEMGSPAFTRELTVKGTTASVEQGGQFHVYEDAFTPVPWEFSGYLPTEEMREQLEAYAALNRRWYLHDHRGRAWKVVFEALNLEARLTQIWNGEWTNEGHDYSATVMVLERDWVLV